MKKPTFFERLSGMGASDPYNDVFEDDRDQHHGQNPPPTKLGYTQGGTAGAPLHMQHASEPHVEPEEVGELAVDVYQTPDFVVVKALVAGVIPTNVDISLTREMLTIRGTREDEREVEDDKYFQQELYWGQFARTIMLPEEVDVDQAEAVEKHGILMIRLPKINKARQTKLRIKSK